MTSQNRLYLNLFCSNRFFTPNDVELMCGGSCQVSCRYRQGSGIILEKPRGGGVISLQAVTVWSSNMVLWRYLTIVITFCCCNTLWRTNFGCFAIQRYIQVNHHSYQWSKWHHTNRHQKNGQCVQCPYFSCTTADFEIKYFINEVTVGVSINTKLIFYDKRIKFVYLNSKLM